MRKMFDMCMQHGKLLIVKLLDTTDLDKTLIMYKHMQHVGKGVVCQNRETTGICKVWLLSTS